jgi:hypothetical protein
VNSINVGPEEVAALRPQANDALQFRRLEATPSMSSSLIEEPRVPDVRLEINLRVLADARAMLAEDARLYGAVSPDLLNEVRTKWPG